MIPDVNRLKRLIKSGLRSVLRPRRFHAYCVGAPKTGTHSLAEVFGKHFRTAHEPKYRRLIDQIVAFRGGAVKEKEFDRYLKERDERLQLEMESSHLIYFYIERLVKLFPKAKFILTVRDVRSWLESWINYELAQPGRIGSHESEWLPIRDLRFKTEHSHPPEEKVLAEHGLYTLDGYLSNWADHNRAILAAVPEERLLVVRTNEIAKELGRIADFLGIRANQLDPGRSHSYRNEKKFDVLSKIDKGYLQRKLDVHCGELTRRFFNESR